MLVTVTGTVFAILGGVFLTVGILSLLRLKKYFPDFYNENSCCLITATLGLSLPLLFRGVVDTLRGEVPAIANPFIMHEYEFNIAI